MNYQQARKIVLTIIFISVGITIALYYLTSQEVTIEYFAIHMIIVLLGFSWLKKKQKGL